MDEQNKTNPKNNSFAAEEEASSPGLSRRGFLRVAGASAVVAATGGSVLASQAKQPLLGPG